MKKKITRNQIEKIVKAKLEEKINSGADGALGPTTVGEIGEMEAEIETETSNQAAPPVPAPEQAVSTQPDPINQPASVPPGKRDSLKLKIAERKRIAAMQQAYLNRIIAEETLNVARLKLMNEMDFTGTTPEKESSVVSEPDAAIEAHKPAEDIADAQERQKRNIEEQTIRKMVRNTIKSMLQEDGNDVYVNDQERGESVPVDAHAFVAGETEYPVDAPMANPVDAQVVKPAGWNNPNPSDVALSQATDAQMAAAAGRQAADALNPFHDTIGKSKRALGLEERAGHRHSGVTYRERTALPGEELGYGESWVDDEGISQTTANSNGIEFVQPGIANTDEEMAQRADRFAAAREMFLRTQTSDPDSLQADQVAWPTSRVDESVSDKEWYDNQLFESLSRKWTK